MRPFLSSIIGYSRTWTVSTWGSQYLKYALILHSSSPTDANFSGRPPACFSFSKRKYP
nr:MAG TPA: hypothetical protein [Caudoviricetes sp.]